MVEFVDVLLNVGGWIVAGLVTLTGVLVTNYLTERSRRQAAHFGSVKALALAPLWSWIINLRPFPQNVSVADAGFKPTTDFIGTLDSPELACVRGVHYPDLSKEWDRFYRDYSNFVGRVVVWAASIEERFKDIVGGRRISSYRSPNEFPGYSADFLALLFAAAVLRATDKPMAGFELVGGRASLDGEVDPEKQYVWVTNHGTTILNVVVKKGADYEALLDRYRTGIPDLINDGTLRSRTAELLSDEKALKARMASIKSSLNKILNLDQTLPGTCDIVEPRWFLRPLAVIRDRGRRKGKGPGCEGPA